MARTSRLLTGSLLACTMVFVAACSTGTSTAEKADTGQGTTTAQNGAATTKSSSDSEKSSKNAAGDVEKASGSFCDQASGYTEFAKKELGTAMGSFDPSSGEPPSTDALMKNMAKMWHNLDDYFSSMASAAPGPIKDDMGVLEDAMHESSAAIDKATTEADLEAASEAMNNPKVTEAADNVAKFAKEKCGVDFDVEPSTSPAGS